MNIALIFLAPFFILRVLYLQDESTRAIGPRAIGPRAIGPRTIGPRAIGPRSIGPRSIAPRFSCQGLGLLSWC